MKQILLLIITCFLTSNAYSSNCDNFRLQISNIITPNCGQSNGKFDVSIPVGTADFTIEWTGAATGSISISGRWYSVKNIPAGNYSVRLSDSAGCVAEENFIIPTEENCISSCDSFSLEILSKTPANCGSEDGTINLQIDSETPITTLAWVGMSSDNITLDTSAYQIQNLAAGDYTIIATDENTCSDSLQVNIAESSCGDCANLEVSVLNTSPPNCGKIDGSLSLKILGDAENHRLTWSRAGNGSAEISDSLYTIENLTTGELIINVIDEYDCTTSLFVILPELIDCYTCGNLEVNLLNPTTPDCNESNGKFDVQIQEGTADFTIAWDGPVSGSVRLSGFWYTVRDLPAGTYSVSVTEDNGRSYEESIVISAEEGCDCSGIDFSIETIVLPSCDGMNGSFEVQFSGEGNSYFVSITNLVADTTINRQEDYLFEEMPEGIYRISAGDDANYLCFKEQLFYFAPDFENCNCGELSIEFIDAVEPFCGFPSGQFSTLVSGRSDGDFEIQVIPLDGSPKNYTFAADTLAERSFRFQNLLGGEYIVLVEIEEACRTAGTFTLNEDCGVANAPSNEVNDEVPSNNIDAFLAFPNPTNGQIIAQANLIEASNIKLEILNAMGQIIQQLELGNSDFIRQEFDLSTQAAGIYFLKLQTENSTQVQQVILMK